MRAALVAALCVIATPAVAQHEVPGETIVIYGQCLLTETSPRESVPPGCDCLFYRCGGLSGFYCTASAEGSANCTRNTSGQGPYRWSGTGASPLRTPGLAEADWPPKSQCNVWHQCLTVLEAYGKTCVITYQGKFRTHTPGSVAHGDLRQVYLEACIVHPDRRYTQPAKRQLKTLKR